MGSYASKTARNAANGVRRYPSRVPPPASRQVTDPLDGSIRPTASPKSQARTSRDKAIELDSQVPDSAYHAKLSQLGPVQPAPTLSHSSTFNKPPRTMPSRSPPRGSSRGPEAGSQLAAGAPMFPSPASNPAVTLLAARARIAREAEAEFGDLGRKGALGRRFLDVVAIRRVLRMRDELGIEEAVIEKELGLGPGVVQKLGPKGVVSAAEG